MTKTPKKSRRWSQRVTKESNSLDLEPGIFSWKNPKRIASSLKHSAEHSSRRKASPFVSAMSMLNFYINRAGKKLDRGQKGTLQAAKNELRILFGRVDANRRT